MLNKRGTPFVIGAISIAVVMCLTPVIQKASAAISTNHSLDISNVIGASTFYANGYTGTRATVANIEAGYVWNGNADLTSVSTYIADASITGQFDRHATWVGSSIAGRGSTAADRGIAYGATLWSGAIATSWSSQGSGIYSGSFSMSTASFTTPYLTAMVTGVSGQTADVINSSWGEGAGQNGKDSYTWILDSLAYKSGKTVVLSAGNSGSSTNTIDGPASGNNALVVGALTGDSTSPAYGSIASFSSRSPSDFFVPTIFNGNAGTNHTAARACVDICAPGTDLNLSHYGGATGGNAFGGATDSSTNSFDTGLAGTSFSSPFTAGAAALVVDAGKALHPTDAHAIDGRVVKAVLMNSAVKPTGWTNGQASVSGVITTTQALDYTYGTGILNMTNAYSQYTGGTTDAASLTGGTVKSVGWTFGHVTHTAGVQANDDYLISQSLAAGSTFTVTLDWFSHEYTNANGGSSAYGSFDNLDLQIWKTANSVPTTLVATSDSLYNSSEHLSFAVPSSGTYMIRVLENSFLWNFSNVNDTGTDFGLAWSGTEVPTPEPATLALLALGSLVLLKRRRRTA